MAGHYFFCWKDHYSIDKLKKKKKEKKPKPNPPSLLWCEDPLGFAHISSPGLGEKRFRDLLFRNFF